MQDIFSFDGVIRQYASDPKYTACNVSNNLSPADEKSMGKIHQDDILLIHTQLFFRRYYLLGDII